MVLFYRVRQVEEEKAEPSPKSARVQTSSREKSCTESEVHLSSDRFKGKKLNQVRSPPGFRQVQEEIAKPSPKSPQVQTSSREKS